MDFLGKKILVLVAHPDDESWLCGGTLLRAVAEGGQVFCVSATAGEKGMAYLGAALNLEQLRAQRLSEFALACRCMGVRQYQVLGYADGELSLRIQALASSLSAVLDQVCPDMVFSFGPDGYTGHSDHVAVYTTAMQVLRPRTVPYYAFCLPPPPWQEEWWHVLQTKRLHGAYVQNLSVARHQLIVDVNAQDKLALLQNYQSQWPGLDPYRLFTPAAAEHFLTHEYFCRLC